MFLWKREWVAFDNGMGVMGLVLVKLGSCQSARWDIGRRDEVDDEEEEEGELPEGEVKVEGCHFEDGGEVVG